MIIQMELYHIWFTKSGHSLDASTESILYCPKCHLNSKRDNFNSKCPFIKILENFVGINNRKYLLKYGIERGGSGGLCGTGERGGYYGIS